MAFSAAAAAAAAAAGIVVPPPPPSKPVGVKIYVGGLDGGFAEPEIEQSFARFGSLEARAAPRSSEARGAAPPRG